jgi:hypothetical protein
MGTQTQDEQEQGGQGGTGAAGGSGAGAGGGEEQRRPAQAFGTASRAPLFSQQQLEGEQEKQPGAAPPGGAPDPKTGRGPVTTAGIPDAALKARLDRAKAQGAEPFFKMLGVKSEAEAKDKLAKLAQAGEEAEKRRLAEMSEIDRLKAENEGLRQELEVLRQQLAQREQEREHEQYDQVVMRVASEQLQPKALKYFRIDLAQHVKKLAETNPELAEKFGERGIKRFAERWVRENPEFAAAQPGTEQQKQAPAARPSTTAPAPKVATPVVRRPVTTGQPQRRNPAPPVNQGGAPAGTMNGKTARPGQANTMSPAEVKAFAAKNGINYTPM